MTTKAERRTTLRELRKVCKDVRKSAGKIGAKVRVKWYPNDECPGPNGTKWTGNMKRAHTHNAEGNKRGLICIAPAWIIHQKEFRWTPPEKWPALFAHEIAHLKTSKNHSSDEFKEIEKRIFNRWRIRNFETRILPSSVGTVMPDPVPMPIK